MLQDLVSLVTSNPVRMAVLDNLDLIEHNSYYIRPRRTSEQTMDAIPIYASE
jgi:hypothetical protein